MPLISIIIPVYNAEKYIHKCLNSILVQTHTNWEAILIDDGSPDNCGAICDEYATKDTRFKVVHQKNRGVSSARQRGLDNAIGEYIIHCDPDDWIEPEMLQLLLTAAIKEDAGMVICDIKEYNNGHSTQLKQDLKYQQTSTEIREKIINQQLHGSLCNKLIKKEYCKNTPFYPLSITMCEDELYNLRVLGQLFKVIYLPIGLYCYNKSNCFSFCNSKEYMMIESRMAVINECETFIDIAAYNSFFTMKRAILSLLLIHKFTQKIPYTYPDIHYLIIQKGRKYNFHLPLSYFLAMAVKGRPTTAYYLYKINLSIIKFLGRVKSVINRKQ